MKKIALYKFFAYCLLSLTGNMIAGTTCSETELTPIAAVVEIPEDCQFIKNGQVLERKNNPDDYVEAYIQGVLDTKYPDSGVQVQVRNGDIILYHPSPNDENTGQIISFVKALTRKSVTSEKRGAAKKSVSTDTPFSSTQRASSIIEKPLGVKSQGIWLPQSTILYPTEIANPRQICFSVGARFNDSIGGRWSTPVSFGDQFPIYRWTNIGGGDLQLELEAGVFALFKMTEFSYPLVNADYYVGVPITYARDKWAYRLRGYHVSSHLGDDYMKNHKHIHRKNKSFEAVDFSAAYNISPKFRVYGTLGMIPFSDDEMALKKWYIQYGAEIRGPRTDFSQLFAQPFFAVFFQNAQDVNYALDSTYALGYEWGKIQGIGRKVRCYLQYHSGFSPEGQFSRTRSKYFAICLSYGF